MLTLPGLIDPHVHLRTPGQTHKEDFTTGTKAAIAGGFTAILDMPNNKVPITSYQLLIEKKRIAKEQIVSDIGFHFGSLGDNLDEFEKLTKYSSSEQSESRSLGSFRQARTLGSEVFGLKLYLNQTTGGFIINSESLTKIYGAWNIDKPILVHAEDDVIDLVIKVCTETKKKTHVCHVSSQEELEKIIRAKKKGFPITCGVTPHHLFLTEEDVKKLGPCGQMKPPVYDGFSEYAFNNLEWIDVIESDHAPHTKEEKESDKPPFGVPNLETTLSLLLTAVGQGLISIEDIKRLCHDGPAKIFGINQDARIEVDENEEWTVKGLDLFTKCKWSPFEGRKLKGKVKKVYIREKLVFNNGKILVNPGFGNVLK